MALPRPAFVWLAFAPVTGGCEALPIGRERPLPTVGPPPPGVAEGCPAALLAGVRLEGDPAADPPVWVVEPSGRRVSVWHRRFSARFSPELELFENGRAIAREGDVLDLGGGSAGDLGFDFFACTVEPATP